MRQVKPLNPSLTRFCTLLVSILLLSACGTPEQKQAVAETNPPTFGSFGIDLTARNENIKPGDDFFNYTNGTWLDSHEIAPDRTSVSMSQLIHERAQERVKAIIEELGAQSGAKGTSEQKVGDYYASWMDTETLNKLGISPLQSDLDRIAAIDDTKMLINEFGMSAYLSSIRPIYLKLGIDPIDPDKYNLSVGLGGMGLPDRDYYLEETERFQKIRKAYLEHITQMLSFANIEKASEKADSILALETTIANLQWVRADRRDRSKTYNPTTVEALKTKYKNYDWDGFLKAAHVTG